MQTSPVMNTIVPAQAQAPKANDASASSDSPNSFNQVLSREMADRNSVNEAPQAKEPDTKNAGAKPAASDNKKDAKAKAADDTDTSAADGGNSADAKDDAAAATNDMLALVASLSQVNPAAQTASQAASAAGQAGAQAPAGVAALPGAIAGRGKAAIEKVGADQGRAAIDGAIDAPTKAKAATTPASALAASAQASSAQAAGKADTPQTFAGELGKANAQAHAAQNAADPKQPLDVPPTPVKSGQEIAAASKEAVAVAAAKTEQLADTKETTAVPALQVQQQSAVNNLTHLAAHAGETLAPRVGTPAWDQALGQKVTWMIAGEQQSASLTLNPPDLGPLQVVLNVTNSQANATFVAAQPEVRQALEAAMPRLRDMLSDAGIQLGQATVSSGSSGQQSAFDQQQSSSGSRRTDVSSTRFDTPVQTARVQPSSSGQGLVDTFV